MQDLARKLKQAREEIKLLREQVLYLRRRVEELETGKPKGRRGRTIYTAVSVATVADVAWEIADRALPLPRGAAPDKLFRALIRRRVRTILGVQRDGRIEPITARVLEAVTPGRRGPRASRLLLANLAFNALAELGGRGYRGVRGKERRLLLARTDPRNSDN